MAIPRPASDRIEIDFSIIFGIDTCHLQQSQQQISIDANSWIMFQFLFFHPYLKATRDHTNPIRLEYVLGLRISLRQTMIKIKRVITLAGGIIFPALESAAPAAAFGCNSAVELDPSLLNPVPACPSFSLSSSPAKLKSPPPKSPVCGVASVKKIIIFFKFWLII